MKQQLEPQNIDAERACLGALLVTPECFLEVAEICSADDFYRTEHREIFKAIETLFNQSRTVDLVTVTDQLGSTGKLGDIGPEYIVSLVQDMPLGSSAPDYARIIVEKATRRRMLEASRDIAKLAYDQDNQVSEMLDQAENRVFNLVSKGSKQKFRSVGAVMPTVFNEVAELSAKLNDPAYKGSKYSGVPTGFTELDELFSGFQNSDLIFVAARPGMGKTALMLNMAVNMASSSDHFPVAFFNLEMSAEALTRRVISAESGITADKLRKGDLTNDDWAAFHQLIKEFRNLPLYIDDSTDVSVNAIRAKCRKLKLEKHIRAVFIDYLQLLSSGTKEDSRVNEVGVISRTLKVMAKELEIPVIVGSQLSRSVERRDDKRPMLQDLRESGSIEQDADIVTFIYRDSYYHKNEDSKFKNVAEIIVGKYRNGPTGTVKLLYDTERAQFKNLTFAPEHK